jgi:hypothetical protein
MLQYSKDGGHTWSEEIWRDIGAMGQFKCRSLFLRLGRGRDWVFRLRVTDPVKTVFIGAWAEFN